MDENKQPWKHKRLNQRTVVTFLLAAKQSATKTALQHFDKIICLQKVFVNFCLNDNKIKASKALHKSCWWKTESILSVFEVHYT